LPVKGRSVAALRVTSKAKGSAFLARSQSRHSASFCGRVFEFMDWILGLEKDGKFV
jgi:hypothetical protein